MEGWAVNYGLRSDKKLISSKHSQCLPEEQLDDGREESDRDMSGVRQDETQSWTIEERAGPYTVGDSEIEYRVSYRDRARPSRRESDRDTES
jgi:hypothetical protein